MALLLGEKLLPILREQAPNLKVRFADVSENIREQIVLRAVDLAVIAYIPDLVRGLSVRRGFQDPFVCVVGDGHELKGRETLEPGELASYRLLELDGVSALSPSIVEVAASEQVSVSASHLIVLPLLASRTSALALIPRSLAHLASQHAPLTIIELKEAYRHLEHCVAWNPADDSDAGHDWFRGEILGMLAAHFS
jgi:DNA-binding transcriptional LysR family regulator